MVNYILYDIFIEYHVDIELYSPDFYLLSPDSFCLVYQSIEYK